MLWRCLWLCRCPQAQRTLQAPLSKIYLSSFTLEEVREQQDRRVARESKQISKSFFHMSHDKHEGQLRYMGSTCAWRG